MIFFFKELPLKLEELVKKLKELASVKIINISLSRQTTVSALQSKFTVTKPPG